MSQTDLLPGAGGSRAASGRSFGAGSLAATAFEVMLFLLDAQAARGRTYAWLYGSGGMLTLGILILFANAAALVLAVLAMRRDCNRHRAVVALLFASVFFLLKVWGVWALLTSGDL